MKYMIIGYGNASLTDKSEQIIGEIDENEMLGLSITEAVEIKMRRGELPYVAEYGIKIKNEKKCDRACWRDRLRG